MFPWVRVEDGGGGVFDTWATLGYEQDEYPGEVRPFGLIALANAIPGMRALTSLDISKNELFAEGTMLLAEALKGNQIMTALNISSNRVTYDGYGNYKEMAGVTALVDAMPGMGALVKLEFGDDGIVGGMPGITMTTDMTEANFSGKLKSYEAQIVVAFLHKCT
jgi:hypothetical protein